MEENVGFFMLDQTKDKKGAIGAILVTDDLGMPQEFRVTYPVKPTRLQQRLYGDSLLVHIGVTLCGEPLYNALKNKPELLIVSSRRYLPLSAKVDSKVARVRQLGEAFSVGTEGESTSDRSVHSKSGRFQPLEIFCSSETEEEFEEIKALVEKYFQGIDLLEPFKRIQSALEALAEQDERFR